MNFWCFMHGPIVLSIRQDASGLRDRGDGVDWSVEPCISYYLGSRVAHVRAQHSNFALNPLENFKFN